MKELEVQNGIVNPQAKFNICSHSPGFISHSFSLMELKFIYHHVLPDLSGKVLVDVGSRLGTVLYGVKSNLWT